MIDELGLIGLRMRIEQLDDDGLIALRQKAAHFGRRVFIGHELGNLQQARKVHAIPFRCILALDAHAFDFLLGIVDQRAEIRLFLIREPRAKHVVNLFPNDPGAVIENMEKQLRS